MSKCQMCGKDADEVYRWYRYDQGEQFRAPVCAECAELHSRLVGGK